MQPVVFPSHVGMKMRTVQGVYYGSLLMGAGLVLKQCGRELFSSLPRQGVAVFRKNCADHLQHELNPFNGSMGRALSFLGQKGRLDAASQLAVARYLCSGPARTYGDALYAPVISRLAGFVGGWGKTVIFSGMGAGAKNLASGPD